jgi:hypothetical protein
MQPPPTQHRYVLSQATTRADNEAALETLQSCEANVYALQQQQRRELQQLRTRQRSRRVNLTQFTRRFVRPATRSFFQSRRDDTLMLASSRGFQSNATQQPEQLQHGDEELQELQFKRQGRLGIASRRNRLAQGTRTSSSYRAHTYVQPNIGGGGDGGGGGGSRSSASNSFRGYRTQPLRFTALRPVHDAKPAFVFNAQCHKHTASPAEEHKQQRLARAAYGRMCVLAHRRSGFPALGTWRLDARDETQLMTRKKPQQQASSSSSSSSSSTHSRLFEAPPAASAPMSTRAKQRQMLLHTRRGGARKENILSHAIHR